MDPLVSPGIYPKMKYYKRNKGYNDEPQYIKIGPSYRLWCMNHVVVYAGDLEKSSMIDDGVIELLWFKNNFRFFSSYESYQEMEVLILKLFFFIIS